MRCCNNCASSEIMDAVGAQPSTICNGVGDEKGQPSGGGWVGPGVKVPPAKVESRASRDFQAYHGLDFVRFSQLPLRRKDTSLPAEGTDLWDTSAPPFDLPPPS
jgi:hypothetical protein